MTLSATELIELIQGHGLRVFTTADLRTLTGKKGPAITQALCRLAKRNLLSRIKRGIWVNRLVENLNPYEAVPHLAAPWPAYVSLYSALAEADLIEEIPQVIYAVSSKRPVRYRTPIGDFHFHHLPESLLWGYEIRKVGRGAYPVAEPEKAFLDLAYLALIPRSPLAFPYQRTKKWNLDRRKLRDYALRFKFPPLMDHLKHLV